MAQVVVRNTFLHFSNTPLASLEDQTTEGKRSSSVPRQWKPSEFHAWSFSDCFSNNGDGSRRVRRHTTASLRLNFSRSEDGTQSSTTTDDFLSAHESFSNADMASDGDKYDCIATDDEGACDFGTEIGSSLSMAYYGNTPTSSYTCSYSLSKRLQIFRERDSFLAGLDDREDSTSSHNLTSYCRTPTGSCSCSFSTQLQLLKEGDVLCVSREREPDAAAGFHVECNRTLPLTTASSHEVEADESSSRSCSSKCTFKSHSTAENLEIDKGYSHSNGVTASCLRTKLKSEAPSFQPLRPTDTRMNAIVSAAHLVLVSCVPPHSLRLEQKYTRDATTSIIVDLDDAPASTLPAHDILQLAKQALDSVVNRVGSATLLSSRIRKQACGYNLQATVACWPQGCEENICWDLLTAGSCPRRKRCRWHHPQAENTMRINVFVNEKQMKHLATNTDEQIQAGSTSERHQIRLTELVQ